MLMDLLNEYSDYIVIYLENDPKSVVGTLIWHTVIKSFNYRLKNISSLLLEQVCLGLGKES